MAASLVEVARGRCNMQVARNFVSNGHACVFEPNLKPTCLNAPHGTTWRQFGSQRRRPKSMTASLRAATSGDEVRKLLRAHVNDPRHLRLLQELPNAGSGVVPDGGAGAGGDGGNSTPVSSLDPFSAVGQGSASSTTGGSMPLPDLSDIVLPPKLTEEEAARWDGQPLPVEPKKGPWLARRGFATPYDPVVAFNQGLQKLGELEGGHAARDLLRALQANECGPGIVPDAFTYTVVMHALVKSGDYTAALDVWRELLASGVRPTVPACGAALNAMAKNGASRWDLALSTVRSMKLRYGAEPNVQCFASALSACAQAGEAVPALELLHEMETYYRVSPNAHCFSAVIAACARRAQFQRVLKDKAASSDYAATPMSEALNAGPGNGGWSSGAPSHGRGPRPGASVAGARTRAGAGVRGAEGEREPGWRTAVGLLRRLEEGSQSSSGSDITNGGDQFTLSSMLHRRTDGAGNDSQINDSSSSNQRRRPNPVVRNLHAISATVSACAASGHWQEALALVGYFNDSSISLPPAPSSMADANAGRLADDHGSGIEFKWLWQRAEREREYMNRRRPSRNQANGQGDDQANKDPKKKSIATHGLGRGVGVVACNAALHACALAEKPLEALQLLDKMQAAGLAPDVVSYTTAIHACSARPRHCYQSCSSTYPVKRATGHHKLALELLQRMESNDVPPNGCTATAAAHACVSSGQWRTALGLLRDAEKSGLLKTSEHDYSLVAATLSMRAWLASGDSEGAEEALTILSDLMCYREEAVASRKKESRSIRGTLSDDDDEGDIDDDFFDDIDDDFLDDGDNSSSETGAEDEKSKDAVLGPDLLCYQIGLEACAMLGRPDRALALVDVMLDQGPAPDVRCFNTVLAAIASAAAKDGRRGGNEDRSDTAEEALNQSYESDVWSILNQIMPLHDVVPDRVGLNSGLAAFARRGMASSAIALFAEHFHVSPDPSDFMKAGKAFTEGLRATYVGGQKPAPDAATYAALLWSLANAPAPPPWTAPDAPPLKCLSSDRGSDGRHDLDRSKSLKEEEVTELSSDPLWLLRRGLVAGTTHYFNFYGNGRSAKPRHTYGNSEGSAMAGAPTIVVAGASKSHADDLSQLAPVWYDLPLVNAALQALVRQHRRHRDALDLFHAALDGCCHLSSSSSPASDRGCSQPNVTALLAALQPSSASVMQGRLSQYRSGNPDVATTASLLRRSLVESVELRRSSTSDFETGAMNAPQDAEADAAAVQAAANVRRFMNRTTFNTAIDAAAFTGDAQAALALLGYLEKEAILQRQNNGVARAHSDGIAGDNDFEKSLVPDDFSYGRTLTACCLRASGADPGAGSQSVDDNSSSGDGDSGSDAGSGNILYLFPASHEQRYLLLDTAVNVLRRRARQEGMPSSSHGSAERGGNDERDAQHDSTGSNIDMHGHGLRAHIQEVWQAVERARGVVGEHKCDGLLTALQAIASEAHVDIKDYDDDDGGSGFMYPR